MYGMYRNKNKENDKRIYRSRFNQVSVQLTV